MGAQRADRLAPTDTTLATFGRCDKPYLDVKRATFKLLSLLEGVSLGGADTRSKSFRADELVCVIYAHWLPQYELENVIVAPFSPQAF
jgi:hypothetical protein